VFGIPTLVALASVWWMRSARLTTVQPFTRRAVSPVLVAVMVPALVFGVSAPAFAANVGVFSFVQNSKPSPFVEAFYEPPQYVVKPVAPTNLVMIYVESLENTYRNEELFGENLMDSLDEATKDWVEFEDFREVRGTGWTIAGIVASQCGVLLKEENSFDLAQQLGLKSINRIGERVNEFMPGITCLGDVLQASGYQNVFLGGADPEFAGKGKFLAEHGYSRVLGRPHWESLGETEFTKWGLYDDDLLRHAKRELDSLHASGEPFNLTVLTVDTHRPEGHLSPTCAARGATELPDIVACTSDMLADFVHYMEREGYLENTAVVITGDHLTMPNVVQDVIDQEEHRTIYNRFYSPRPITPNRDELMHFSIFPTVLDMLSFGYPGRGLALGVSALRPLEESELTIYDVADLDDKLRRPSDLYDTFWGVEPSSSSQRD
jgi:phosphoglycerol transferase